MSAFTQTFLMDFFKQIHTIEKDNWDYLRFGENQPNRSNFLLERAVNWMEAIIENHSQYEEALQLMHDDYSKALMIKLLEYDVLDHHHVKLPLNTPEYWDAYRSIDEQYLIKRDVIRQVKNPLNLYAYPEMDLKIYGNPLTILTMFINKQYYLSRAPFIRPEPGDVCIDAGSCRGEVALHFMHSVGETGAVHAFEFVPGNIEILKKNMELNKHLSANIKIAPYALWNTSDQLLSFTDRGPSSAVGTATDNGDTLKAKTITLDDYVENENLRDVNFIKMDIEGAELNALTGAVRTIRNFKPKLAICAYHKMDDFYTIPKLIKNILPGYRFYLDHYTIHREETVLFAEYPHQDAVDKV